VYLLGSPRLKEKGCDEEKWTNAGKQLTLCSSLLGTVLCEIPNQRLEREKALLKI